MRHIVTDIQRFCMHDGPGIRTTVFLKGCPLRCFWCHNPETQKQAPQPMRHKAKCIGCGACARGADQCLTGALTIAGKEMESEEILSVVWKDKAFYGETGGLTLSGGEPMLHPEKCIELLRLAKAAGLHTAVETCGYFPQEYVRPLCEAADLLLWDVKDTDDERHRTNTGVSNETILANLRLTGAFATPVVLRCVLLKGVNLNAEHLQNVEALYRSLPNAVDVTLLPCHSLGSAKGEAIGAETIDLSPFEPSVEDMAWANAFLQTLKTRPSR